MENLPLKELFKRYLQNKCAEDEIRAIIQYFDTDNVLELRELIQEELEKTDEDGVDEHLHLIGGEVFKKIKQKIKNQNEEDETHVVHLVTKNNIFPWARFSAAACLIGLLGSAIYFTTKENASVLPMPRPLAVQPTKDTLAPAGNKAMLILSNGQEISLDGAPPGQLAQQANAVIHKTADGKIEYNLLSGNADSAPKIALNILKTPRGGKYNLTLSDGTRVWLNAVSSIRYPSVFPDNNREVEISGEAYFEVAHDSKRPFRVFTAGQTIEDLGTRFNVNAYDDEPNMQTTLLEGSVRVSNKLHSALLTHGQQAILGANQSIKVNTNADIDEVMSWHHDLFNFQDADIKTVMRQLSRWYDVDITYEGKISERRFSGKIHRNVSALKVADILSYKQIHFRIEGRKIIVMP